MNEYILFDNGQMTVMGNKKYIHNKFFSIIKLNGDIIHFLQNYLLFLHNNNKYTLCIIFLSNYKFSNAIFNIYKKAELENKTFIVATLGQIVEYPCINYLYLPFDDTFFKHKISFNMHYISWEDRKSTIFWRGSCNNINSVRIRTVQKLFNFPDTDVKFINYNNKDIPSHYFANKVHFSEFFKYKIFLIIDSDNVTSSYMWAFATGCLPLIISNIKHWFSTYLKPFVNYVPVKYDLSDLEHKIEWIRNNDILAKQIAKNAYLLSKKAFSPNYQQKYIMNSIENIIIPIT